MAAKPSDTVAVKVRIKEKLRRDLEAEAKRDGISVNAAIDRRLNRTLIDDMIMAFINRAAKEAAAEYSKVMAEHISNLMGDVAKEFADIRKAQAQTDRMLSLHELIINPKKEDSNG
jgi:hypothetical protein